MEAKDRPRLHADDHLKGGADPLKIEAPSIIFPGIDPSDLPLGALWPLTETSGGIAADATGNGYDLTVTGYRSGTPGDATSHLGAWSWADTARAGQNAPGVFGGGVRADSATLPSLGHADEFAIVTFFNVHDVFFNNPQLVFQGSDIVPLKGWSLNLSSTGPPTRLNAALRGGTATGITGPLNVNQDGWNMAVLQCDGASNWELWLNADLIGTDTGTIATAGGIRLGADIGGAFYLRGWLSTTMWVTRMLTGLEIETLANGGVTPPGVVPGPEGVGFPTIAVYADGAGAIREAGVNYKTSASGLLVPSTVDNPTLGPGVVDVSYEMTGPGDATKFLKGTNPPTWSVPTATPSGSAGGDLTGTYPSPTLAAAGAGAAGPIGDSTHIPIVTVDAKGRVTALSSVAAAGGSPTGSAGGDLTGSYPNPTLAAAGPGATGPLGDATHAPAVTIDAKGRVTALSSVAITGTAPGGSAGGDLTGTYPNPTLATAGPGATGPVGDGTHSAQVTIDAKGRVTALTSTAITVAGIGGADQSDVLWQKTFWSDQGLLPATSYIERKESFGAFDFEDSRATLTKDVTLWKGVGVASTGIHFSFDTGAARSKIFFLIGIAGLLSGAQAWGPHVSDAATNANGDTTGNTYHVSASSTTGYWDSLDWFKQTAGTFGAALTSTKNFVPPKVMTGLCLIYNGTAHTLSLWIRFGAEQWLPLSRLSDSSFSTMRQCGIRLFGNSDVLLLGGPVVIYYTT